MRTCSHCGRRLPEDVDFCVSCGEFLGWPERSAPGAAAVHALAPPRTAPEYVSLAVFRADDADEEGMAAVSVAPGGRALLKARVRNQGEIVDSYELAIEGLPGDWWTLDPPTSYLLPLTSRSGYEEDVTIAIHPPRSALATAGRWTFAVVVKSQSHPTRVARATASVDIEPFWGIGAAARPEIVSGRRRRSFFAEVHNSGNAPLEVGVEADDSEGRCRFGVPADPARVQPGDTVAVPVVVRPARPHLIGRRIDHRLELAATAAGDEELSAPFAAMYRQRPWIPWWLPLLLLLLVVVAIVLWLLWPDRTTVPDVRRSRSAFVAQKRLERSGLTLNPKVESDLRPRSRPGSVVDQAPPPGKEVDEGKAVAVVVATGRGSTTVPKLKGLRVSAADQRLQKAGLALGAVEPKLDPDGKVGSQLPRSGVERRRGTPVNVVLKPPKGKEKEKEKEAKPKAAAAGGGPAPLPAAGGKSAGELKEALKEAGLEPTVSPVISPAKPGTVLRTVPPEGEPPPEDRKVTIVVSAGFPMLAYDTGRSAYAAGGIAGRPVQRIARRGSVTGTGAWSADGKRVVYVSEGRLYLADPGSGKPPRRLAVGDRRAYAAAVAPHPRRTVVAFVDRRATSGGDAVCWIVAGARRSSRPSCLPVPRWHVDGFSWRRDGALLLARAWRVERVGEQRIKRFGLLRLKARTAFSGHAANWSADESLATPSPRRGGENARRGVLAGAFSPDGERVAVVADLETPYFQVATVAADDLRLEDPRWLPITGCEVAWRQDGEELAVVQSGTRCVEDVGAVVRVRLDDPRTLHTVVLFGDDPSWQPIDLKPGRAR